MAESVYCGGCGKKLPPGKEAYCDDCSGGWNYCYACGEKLSGEDPDACSACGTEVPMGCLPVIMVFFVGLPCILLF